MITRSKQMSVFTLGLASFLYVVAPLSAQDASSDSATSPEVILEMPKSSDVVLELPGGDSETTAISRESDLISVDFPDEDIRQIIRNVADLYDLNIHIPEQLQGRVTIKLKDVRWDQVFKVILEPIGYTYVTEDNIILIKTIEEVNNTPPITQVFDINFATAAEVATSVAPLIDSAGGGRLQVDKRSNKLIITDKPQKLSQIRAIIDDLDRPTEQVMIESKFVEVTNRDLKDIGVRWDSLGGYAVSGGPFARQYTKDNTYTNENTKTIPYTDPSTPGGSQQSPVTELRTLTDSLSFGRADTAIFNADSFALLLSALNNENKIEVVSNPTVVTLNNTPAKINIGEEYPIPDYRYNDTTGTFEVAGFEYKEIGIILAVTPQVNSAGFINLNITPEISSRTGQVPFGGQGGAQIPIITTRKTQSTVTIKSGFTLAIGGLIEKNDQLTTNAVPLLSKIPLIGNAFKHKSDSYSKRNLIIFITAKTLNADGSTYRDIFSQRTLFEMGIKSRDLPGYQPDEAEQELFESIQNSRDNLEQTQAEIMLRKQLELLNKNKQNAEKKLLKDSDSEDNNESGVNTAPLKRKNAP